jgi:nitrate/nitrite transporter NarK
MDHPGHGEHRYRWMILSIMALLFFMVNFAEFQIAGVAGHLASALHLGPMQLAMCLFAPFLMNFALGIPIGMAADRFGTKAIGSAVLIVSCAGIIGRAYGSTDFTSCFVWMLVFGLSMVFANALGPKILRTWFKSKDMPLAMGIFIASAGLGVGAGEATAPLFASLTATFTLGWALFAAATAWFLVGFRSKPAGQPDAPPQQVFEFLGVAARNRHVWLAGLAALFFFAGVVGTAGNLPAALIQSRGASAVAAGLMGLPLGIGSALGGFFVPMILRRAHGIRVRLAALVVIGAALLLAALVVPFGPMTGFCVIAGALISNGLLTLTLPVPVMLREIGTTYGGSAGGIVSLLQSAGGFFIPTFVIPLIAGANATETFAVIFALYAISALLVLALPERGFRELPAAPASELAGVAGSARTD